MSQPWTLNIPALANLQPLDPTRGPRFATGPYEGLIVESGPHVAKDAAPGSAASSIKFKVKCTEGENAGREIDIFVGIADMTKEISQRSWLTLLQSIGVPAQALNQPNQLGTTTFANKKCYFFVQAAPEGEAGKGKFDDKNFITPDQYQKLKAAAQAQGAVAGGGMGMAAAPAFPAVGGAPVGGAPAFAAQPGLPGMGGGIPQPQNGVAQLGAALGQPAQLGGAPAAGGGGVSF